MDINKASAEDLERTFEVDGERAGYIIEKRKQMGGFDSWEQIKEVVPSIDEKMVENLRAAGLTFGTKESRSDQGTHADATATSEGSRSARSSDRQSRKDVNSVTREELEKVCQIDGERADYFLRARRELGGFNSWEDIKEKVPSFDAGMIKRLKNAGYGVGTKAA